MSSIASNVSKPRGFAALTPERRKEISRKGGVSAHVKGSAHEWDTQAAREAGRKGGLSHAARRTSPESPPSGEAPPRGP
ncbi:MAG TPA: stress-induced protein [Polyangia bacterium]|nr:stress-induced protein [Polyangia bacterium]